MNFIGGLGEAISDALRAAVEWALWCSVITVLTIVGCIVLAYLWLTGKTKKDD